MRRSVLALCLREAVLAIEALELLDVGPRVLLRNGLEQVDELGVAELAGAVVEAPVEPAVVARERAQVLYRLKALMERDLDELCWLVSHENGKVFGEAKAEVEKGIECVEYGCSLPNLAAGNQLEVSRGVACEVAYAPLGVVAGITPFNFPLMVPLWMLPQALVGGNAFILKPSERVPLSSQYRGASGCFSSAGSR